jgi:hypothetical protein
VAATTEDPTNAPTTVEETPDPTQQPTTVDTEEPGTTVEGPVGDRLRDVVHRIVRF